MSKYHQGSFIAQLYSTTPGHEGCVRVTEHGAVPTDDGWLTLDENAQLILFNFVYQTQTDDRIHFKITAVQPGRWEGTTLELSRNDYLGLYSTTSTADFWKVEPLGDWQKDSTLDFILRSHHGRQVGIYKGQYLTLGTEPVATFQARIVARAADEIGLSRSI